MVGLFAVWARRVACFIAAWPLALPLAHADPSGDPAASVAAPLSKELEGHLWRIAIVAFETSVQRRSNDDLYAHGDDGSEAYLAFENGEIGGSLGCGQLAGRYSLYGDSVQISMSWTNERCSIEFRTRTNEVISALRRAVRLERGGDDAFHLFDEQKTYFIRLELLGPGFDLSEFRSTFWQLVSLEGNPITEPDAEVRLGREAIEISMSKFRAQYAFRYRSKTFLSQGPWSTTRPEGRDLPRLFETFKQVLHRIATYRANDDELTALDASGQQIMLLRRIPPAGLEYRYWHIVQYGMDGWLNPTVRPLQIMTFVRGEVRGAAGCRGWSGTYTLVGDSLSVRAGTHSGTGSCSVATENEERIILHALNKVSRVKEEGARVLLLDGNGNTHLVLAPYAPRMPTKTLQAVKRRDER